MNEIIYQRLTRLRSRGFSFAVRTSRASLWLGPDHLLCMDSNGYTENYKRFYFRDIQIITVQKTIRRSIWNWFLGSLSIACLAPFIGSLMGTPSTGIFVFISIAGVALGIPLLLNNLLGPTCAAQLRTAVQIESLPSLCRLRQTRKVLAKIRPYIAAAQGELTAAEISGRLRENIQPVFANPPPKDSSVPPIIS